MSNINIILKSNKAEFTNFFREPIIIPANSEVALVKGNITIPVFVQQKLTVPALAVGDRGGNWITVTIDGIRELFTWTDLFTAFNAYIDGLDQTGAAMTANNFFSGNYSFFINNPIWASAVANIQEKTIFNEVFASMLNSRYIFYFVGPKLTWKRAEPEIISGLVTLNPTWGANTTAKSFPASQTEWGISAEYNPSWAIAAINQTALTLDAADNFTWITGVPAQWTSGGGGVAGVYDNIYINNRNAIDPNGGWLGFQYNSVANTSYVGLSITTGNINTGGTGLQAPVLPATILPSIVDIGFKFTHAGAAGTYQIVDGHIFQPVYQGVTIVNYSTPILYPVENYRSFDNNTDYFYIQVARAGIVSPSEYKYTISLYRNDGAAIGVQPSTDGVLLYQTTRTLNSPAISVSPIFLSDGVGNEVKAVSHIPALAQSFEQGRYNSDAPTQQGMISIEPNIAFLALPPIKQDVLEFMTILGLESFQDDPLVAVNSFNANDARATKLIMDWAKPIQILGKDCDKYIGINDPNKIYSYITAPNHYGLQTNQTFLTGTLPRMLDVSILDSTLKNVSGNAPATAINGVAVGTFETSTIDRVVGTIPTDLDADNNDNFDWILDYEPYTPVYRPLNNPVPLNISQMLIEVSYRDFNTGQKRNLENIDGTLNLELHIRPGRKPPPIQNNIRPF